jgi:hypothetical protein
MCARVRYTVRWLRRQHRDRNTQHRATTRKRKRSSQGMGRQRYDNAAHSTTSPEIVQTSDQHRRLKRPRH